MERDEEKFFEELARSGGRRTTVRSESDEEEVKPNTPTPRIKKAAEEEGEPEGQLTLDVYQTAEEIVVESAIAGVKPEDIDIDVMSDSISIRGERRKEHHIKNEDYFYQECYWGRFSRSVILPQEVDPENATVTFKNGVLTVKLPKVNRKKSRKLKVRFE